MYSAETAESRNYTSPREFNFQQVGRSQSCVSYNRWGAAPRSQVARGMMVENQRSFMHVKRMYSQGATTSQRSNDYFSPTVSSIMKRNSSSSKPPPRQSAVHSPSPRWMFWLIATLYMMFLLHKVKLKKKKLKKKSIVALCLYFFCSPYLYALYFLWNMCKD